MSEERANVRNQEMKRLGRLISSGKETGPDEWRCGSCGKYHTFKATTCTQCGNPSPRQRQDESVVNRMNIAEQIVENLLEADDEKPKKPMPDWLKKIKGIKDDDDGGEEKSGEGESKEPKAEKSSGDKGVGKAKGGEGKVEHTF